MFIFKPFSYGAAIIFNTLMQHQLHRTMEQLEVHKRHFERYFIFKILENVSLNYLKIKICLKLFIIYI